MKPLDYASRSVFPAVMTTQPPAALFPFLADLSDTSQQLLADTQQRVCCPGGTALVKRGDEVSSAYLVTRGALRVYYVSAEGREGTLYWVEPGQSCILALNCMFSRVHYPAWVESEGETEVTIVPGATYRALFQREAAVQGFTFAALSSRLFELMAMIEETSSQGLETRIAGFLLRRAKGANAVDMTQDQIARHLGTSREVVSRVLRRLAGEGLIETAPAHINLRDMAGLQHLVQ
jgi:CRP/FNR family transcriptional regulator